MYYVWRVKPRAVLGQGKDWIPASKIEKQIDRIAAFRSPKEAQDRIQESGPSDGDAQIIILNAKTFRKKARIKKLPARDRTEQDAARAEPSSKPAYTEYLEEIADDAVSDADALVFPPKDTEETCSTERIQAAKAFLERLQEGKDSLEDEITGLRKKIHEMDLLISDRLHQAEFCDLDDEGCSAYVASLKKELTVRRRYKNELATLCVLKDAMAPIKEEDCKCALKQIDRLSKQSYHCRVLRRGDT